MDANEFKRIAFAVSIFHMYGHAFKCQARFSPRFLSKVGLTDGEGCERIWSWVRYLISLLKSNRPSHLIPSLRSSSHLSRRQFLTSNMLAIAEEKRFQLSNAFVRLFNNAIDAMNKSWKEMQTLQDETKMSRTEIEAQAQLMNDFYSTLPENSPATPYYDDEICEILLAREVLAGYVESLLCGNGPAAPNSWKKLREYVAGITDGRIHPKSTPSSLTVRLDELLNLAGQTIDRWITVDGQYTDHFYECEEKYRLRQLKICKYEIWKAWILREIELGQLHGSSVVGISFQIIH